MSLRNRAVHLTAALPLKQSQIWQEGIASSSPQTPQRCYLSQDNEHPRNLGNIVDKSILFLYNTCVHKYTSPAE